MLEWPITRQSHHPLNDLANETETLIYRTMLKAFFNTEPFTMIISINPVTEGCVKALSIDPDIKAKILLEDGREILTLEQYRESTAFKGRAYTSLYDWVELYGVVGDYPTVERELSKWSILEWRLFLKNRLKDQIGVLQNKAQRKRNDAFDLENGAINIRKNLKFFF